MVNNSTKRFFKWSLCIILFSIHFGALCLAAFFLRSVPMIIQGFVLTLSLYVDFNPNISALRKDRLRAAVVAGWIISGLMAFVELLNMSINGLEKPLIFSF